MCCPPPLPSIPFHPFATPFLWSTIFITPIALRSHLFHHYILVLLLHGFFFSVCLLFSVFWLNVFANVMEKLKVVLPLLIFETESYEQMSIMVKVSIFSWLSSFPWLLIPFHFIPIRTVFFSLFRSFYRIFHFNLEITSLLLPFYFDTQFKYLFWEIVILMPFSRPFVSWCGIDIFRRASNIPIAMSSH